MNTTDIIIEAATYYYNSLLNSESCLSSINYLESRGITLPLANIFTVGTTICNNKFLTSDLTNYLSNNFNPLSLVNSKLSKIRKLKRTYSDKYEFKLFDHFGPNRIIFPIFIDSRPAYITSRSTVKNDEYKHLHMNTAYDPPPIFNQDTLIHNQVGTFYITESAIDALSLESIGLHAIATLGTRGISLQHEQLFNKISTGKKFVFIFDNDKNGSGNEGVKRSSSILRSFGINEVYKINLPKLNGEPKTDINQLLCLAIEKYGENGRSKFANFFSSLTPEIVDIEPFYKRTYKFDNEANKTLIYNIISRHLNDIRKVNETTYKTKCPFHNDTVPSMVIYTVTNTYKCFGCGKYGGPIRFLMDLLNISRVEAIEEIRKMEE